LVWKISFIIYAVELFKHPNLGSILKGKSQFGSYFLSPQNSSLEIQSKPDTFAIGNKSNHTFEMKF